MMAIKCSIYVCVKLSYMLANYMLDLFMYVYIALMSFCVLFNFVFVKDYKLWLKSGCSGVLDFLPCLPPPHALCTPGSAMSKCCMSVTPSPNAKNTCPRINQIGLHHWSISSPPHLLPPPQKKRKNEGKKQPCVKLVILVIFNHPLVTAHQLFITIICCFDKGYFCFIDCPHFRKWLQ